MSSSTEASPVQVATPPRQIKEVTRTGYMASIEAMRAWAIRKRIRSPEEPPLVNLIDLAQDIMSRDDLSARSKNAYRAALLWRLRERPIAQLDSSDLAALHLLEAWAPWELPRPKLRPRSIRLADLEKLNDELLSQGGKWALRTSHWLQAGLASGLRPREWIDTHWTDANKTTLHVNCGKTKLSTPAFLQNTDRYEMREEPFGTGTTEREIPIAKDFDRMVIDAHLRNIQSCLDRTASMLEQDRQFTRYYDQCRNSLHRACQKIWNGQKTYSLYTMRSQFSANTKAAFGSDIAATLMGHSSKDSPSTGHYGKASQAHTRSTRASSFSGFTPREGTPTPTLPNDQPAGDV